MNICKIALWVIIALVFGVSWKLGNDAVKALTVKAAKANKTSAITAMGQPVFVSGPDKAIDILIKAIKQTSMYSGIASLASAIAAICSIWL